MKEREVLNQIRLALGLEPGLILWRNTVGHCVEFDKHGRQRHITYGLAPGSADLIGCLDGRFVAIEVKKPGEKPRADQEQWAKAVRAVGGFYAAVTSIEEARAAIARAGSGAVE